MAWGDGREERRVHPDDSAVDMGKEGLFLINHTQRVYIDLDQYRRKSEWFEESRYNGSGFEPFVNTPWCINPLPLLTACGNDRGGGDYRSGNASYDKVGTWAFDKIELSDEKPADYDQFTVVFSEQKEKIA